MGDVMGDISHLQKEGVSLKVKHPEQGLTQGMEPKVKQPALRGGGVVLRRAE